MSRKIKFRIWDVDKGVFHYWTPLSFEALIDWDASQKRTDDGNGSLDVKGWYGAEKSEQFTGLVDKDGVEIYEGDLCRHVIGWTAMATATTWLNDDDSPSHAFTYAFTIPGTPYREDFRFVRPEQLTVVGNVHQHPHLLSP